MKQNCVAVETFLQVCECAWEHLEHIDQGVSSIRATCRDGRLLHSRLLKKLEPQLCICGGPGSNNKLLAPDELCKLVSGLRQRGARPEHLELNFVPARDKSIAQLLALLKACADCPLNTLHLAGCVPHATAVSEAVAACCPRLTKLTLDYDYNDFSGQAKGADIEREYTAGVVSLLQLVGPRLRELEVAGSAHHWAPQCFDALSHCTALTRLDLPALESFPYGSFSRNRGFKCAETSRVLSSVCGLTGLRSLRLDLRLHPDNMTLDAVRPHATSLAQLGALTVLTRLHLELSDCYEPAGDSWDKQQEDGEEHEAWEEVREVQRTSLLSALRCMPQLQDLSCRTLWLRPSEAASLAALTSLTLGRLLAPQDGMAAGVAAPASGALPPQLRTLSLRAGASPSVLAALQPPPSLTELDLSSIRFGTTDVSRGCKVLPEAVQAFGEAVRLVMHYLPKCRQQEQRRIQVVAACGDDLMMPPDQAGCEGHAGWIRQLAPLGAWLTGLQIRGIRLTHGDLQCLVSELPNLQALELSITHVVPSTLAVLTRLQQLDTLTVDFTHCGRLRSEDLEATLSLLCRGIKTLESLTVIVSVSVATLRQRVESWMQAWGAPVPVITIKRG